MHFNNSKALFWSLNQKLTLKTQILVISLLFSALIFSILIIAIFASQNYINGFISTGSNQIFERQTKIQLNNNMWAYRYGMDELIEITKRQISSIRKFHQLVEKRQKLNHSIPIENPKTCLRDTTEADSYCFENSWCCGIFGDLLNENLEYQIGDLMKTISLLNIFRLEFDVINQSVAYVSSSSQAQYFCLARGTPFPITYKPQERSYYLDHLKSMENSSDPLEYFFANPFPSVSGRVKCPITTSLWGLNNQFLGLIAKDLDFNYSQVGLKKYSQNFTSYILGQNGEVIFNDKYHSTSQPAFYFNESKYTGFNESDYEQIMLHHYGKLFVSNCLNFYSSNILCRQNSEFNDNAIIQTSNITASPFIVEILSKTNYIKEQENIQVQFINTQLKETFMQALSVTIFASIGVIMTGQLIIFVMLQQLNNIIEKINNAIYQSNQIYILSQRNQNYMRSEKIQDFFYFLFSKKNDNNLIKSNLITKLTSTIIELFSQIKNNTKKCFECQFQENLFYPVIKKVQTKNFRVIKLCQSLQNSIFYQQKYRSKILGLIYSIKRFHR